MNWEKFKNKHFRGFYCYWTFCANWLVDPVVLEQERGCRDRDSMTEKWGGKAQVWKEGGTAKPAAGAEGGEESDAGRGVVGIGALVLMLAAFCDIG